MLARVWRRLCPLVLALCAAAIALPVSAVDASAPDEASSAGAAEAIPGATAIARGLGTPARYIVFAREPDGSVRAVFSKRVTLRGPLPGRNAGAGPAGSDADQVRVRIEDARQAVVFEDIVAIPRWIRGEFHGQVLDASGERPIDSHLIPQRSPAFVVRVPDIAGTTLMLESPALQVAASFDLAAIDALDTSHVVAEGVPPPPPAPLPGWNNGDPANRLDILIMGDGYTAAQQSKFTADAQTLADGFFAITPYNEYRNYANVTALFTASTQAGVDQPTYNPSCSQNARVQTCCSDPAANGTTPRTAATAFAGTFCSYNTQRLVTVDDALVFAAASAQPDWDKIMVLVNSGTYGGSGGALSVVSTDSQATQVAQHEFGHSFTRLADEYTTPYPGYPSCSDLPGTTSPCEPNVTDQTSRALIKWTRWISVAQAVPSSGAPPVQTNAGLWQGARYQSAGMYRQGFSCIMQVLGKPFCDVASEAYALRLYQGGWGVPAAGIDNIEPGTESPVPGGIDATYPGGTYQATVLGPQTGPNVTAEWRVDGGLVKTQSLATGASASHALAASVGPHLVELRVTDNSPIIHPTMRAATTSLRSWTITVTKASTTIGITTITPSPSVLGAPYTVYVALGVIAPGGGTPTGTINVGDGAVGCAIALPATSCNIIPAGLGSTTLTATYGGDANFNGSVSAGVGHVVVVPGLPPTLQGVVSRKVHGAAGTFDLPLSMLSTNPSTEPRTGPAQTLVLVFDKPLTAGGATVTEGVALVGTPTFNGNEMIVPLTGVANQQYVSVTASGVTSSDGGVGGSGSVRIGYLLGDVNQSRAVTLADLGLVNAQVSQAITAANYLKDVNASGTLTLADKGVTNTQVTKALPAP